MCISRQAGEPGTRRRGNNINISFFHLNMPKLYQKTHELSARLYAVWFHISFSFTIGEQTARLSHDSD